MLRQLNPILSFVGAYKPELNAFFSNTVAVTQATTPPDTRGNRVHYLRTMNPMNAENLAVYPRRIGSNRPNPYELPGAFAKLKEGLPQYETRHCANGVPTIVDNSILNPLTGLPVIGDKLVQQIRQFGLTSGTGTLNVPCKQQGPYSPTTTPSASNTGLFPHVAAAASGSARSARRSK